MNMPAVTPEQIAQRLALAIRKLDEQAATGLQELGRPLREGAVKVEAIGAAIQRQARVVVAHLRRQSLDLDARNVRGVADDQIKRQTTRQRGEAVAQMELNLTAHLVQGGVFLSDAERRL